MYLNISLVLLFGIIAIPGVGAHGYVTSPRSRNFVASQDGKWWGGTSNDPDMESCPHCLNRGGLCGLIGDHDYNYPKNALGGPMPLNIQEILQKGQEFDFSAVLTAHHKGHFEYKACPIQAGEVPTQECFDNYPLEFVKDILYNAPQDPNYPERAYIPLSSHSSVKDSAGSYLYTHTYKLPMDISGDIVLIQWHYVTANSCLPEGYNDYDWPEGFYPGNSDTCGPLPVDGNGVPEQFWNCVEVKITSDSTPTEPPVSSPTENPTNTSPVNPPVPTIATVSPIAAPTLSPVPPTVSPIAAPTISPVSPTVSPTAAQTLPPVPPTIAPTESPVQVATCPAEYTGLIPANGCTVFYHCLNGSLVSEVPIYCPEGLLYTSDEVCMCNFVFVL